MNRELTEEELENIVGGIPYEAAIERQKSVVEQEEQKLQDIDTVELTEEQLEQIRAGVPYIPFDEEESMKL